MSGLFRRLARQATGQPQPTVHSMARLPYHAPPEWQASAEAEPAMLTTPIATSDPVISSTAGYAVRPPVATDDMAQARAMARDRHDMEGPAPTDAPPTVVGPPSAPPRTNRVAPGAAPPSARSHRPRGDAPVAGAQPDNGSTEISRPIPSDTPIATHRLAPARPGHSIEDSAPAALLPNAAPTARVIPPDGRPVAAAAATARAPEPAEVHIHIGRIEVTALPAPPTPKRTRKAGAAPLSLDDYLAKRQRSSS